MSTPVAHFSRRYRLSASHRLHTTALTDAQNRDTYGKCNNPHGHGHNYTVEVTVAGPIAPESGFVVDMVKLDALVQREVLNRFDHRNLNQDKTFSGTFVPSTENLAMEIERVLCRDISLLAGGGSLRLANVRVEETRNNSFDLPSTLGMPELHAGRTHAQKEACR